MTDKTRISNHLAQDRSLTYEAKGVMAWILSQDDDYTLEISDLCDAGKSGKEKCRKIVKELISAGYLTEKRRMQNPDGTYYYLPYKVHQFPVDSIEDDFPKSDVVDPVSSYIYILKNQEGLFKIGVSTHIPTRITNLSKKEGNLTLVASLYSDSAYRLEYIIHKSLDKYRAYGEFFNLSEKHLSELIDSRGFTYV